MPIRQFAIRIFRDQQDGEPALNDSWAVAMPVDRDTPVPTAVAANTTDGKGTVLYLIGWDDMSEEFPDRRMYYYGKTPSPSVLFPRPVDPRPREDRLDPIDEKPIWLAETTEQTYQEGLAAAGGIDNFAAILFTQRHDLYWELCRVRAELNALLKYLPVTTSVIAPGKSKPATIA